MLRSLPLIIFLVFVINVSRAQTISYSVFGKIVDAKDQSEVVGALVVMVNIKDSTRSKYSVTDGDGNFKIPNLEKSFYRLQISSLSYKPATSVIRLQVPEMDLGTIALQQDVTELNELEIKGEAIAMEQVGDTTQYNAAAYKVNPDANASDLVSKMPGLVIDGSGVTSNGESIQQVLLDGKRFFGQDPLLALNTIPAEIVKKIQVYDDQSDQSKLTGFNDGKTTKTMNVVTKEDKRNGQFGKSYAGYGTDDRNKLGVNLNSFDQDKRLTIIGLSNNINQQNFSDEDIAQVGGGGGRGGFRGGGNGNFMTGNQSGITKTNSIGINFSDKWGEKATFEGSYFFNQTNNTNNSTTSRESFLEKGNQFYNQSQTAIADNLNHRLNMRVKYDLNKNNTLRLNSSMSYQDNQRDEHTIGETRSESGEVINGTNNTYSSVNQAYNLNNNLTFQHKFTKIGRTLSLDVNSTLRPTNRENFYEDTRTDSLIQYLTKEYQNAIGYKATYTEPIGSSAQLTMSYQMNQNNRKSNKDTYTFEEGKTLKSYNETLSNHFISGYTTHVPSITYSNNKFGEFFNAGLAYQYAVLDNTQLTPKDYQLNRSFNSILPTVMSRVQFSENADLFFRYSTSTNEPSANQLQEVLDNSNPLFLSVGNSNLRQSYSHDLMVRVQKSNPDKNTSLSNFIRVNTSANYITNGTNILQKDSTTAEGIVLQRGAQLKSPINLNGYWNAQNNTTFGVLISPIKSNLNTSIGFSYVRQPGLNNNVSNISNSYGTNAKLALVSNISPKIDYNVYYQINGNLVKNEIRPASNSQYYTQTMGAKLNLIVAKGLVFRNDITHQIYKGVNSSFDTQYTLWNMSVAKKFLKNDSGELELSVFDLLGQNQSFSQNVNATYLEETNTQVLQRYFMLTFSYQLRRFKTSG
jgi:hypothetical protein